jgi:hypothetical protein
LAGFEGVASPEGLPRRAARAPKQPSTEAQSPAKGDGIRLRIPGARSVLGTLVLADGLLVLLYWLSRWVLVDRNPTLAHMFDLDGEGNGAAWYASSKLLLVAAIALLYALQQVEPRALRRFYYLLAAVFLFFSADEAAMFHEPLNYFVREQASFLNTPGPDHTTWQFLYLAVMVVVLVMMRKGLAQFLRCSTGRLAFLVGAGLFVAGGVVVEFVGYYVLVSLGDSHGSAGAIQVALEEFCELLGVSLMAYGLFTRLHALEPSEGRVPAAGAHD